jgi:hypothetical protein
VEDGTRMELEEENSTHEAALSTLTLPDSPNDYD